MHICLIHISPKLHCSSHRSLSIIDIVFQSERLVASPNHANATAHHAPVSRHTTAFHAHEPPHAAPLYRLLVCSPPLIRAIVSRSRCILHLYINRRPLVCKPTSASWAHRWWLIIARLGADVPLHLVLMSRRTHHLYINRRPLVCSPLLYHAIMSHHRPAAYPHLCIDCSFPIPISLLFSSTLSSSTIYFFKNLKKILSDRILIHRVFDWYCWKYYEFMIVVRLILLEAL